MTLLEGKLSRRFTVNAVAKQPNILPVGEGRERVRGGGGGVVKRDTRYLWSQQLHKPILTGKPAGSFMATNSFNLLKCLNGATTSNTLRILERRKIIKDCYSTYGWIVSVVGVRKRGRSVRGRRNPFQTPTTHVPRSSRIKATSQCAKI